MPKILAFIKTSFFRTRIWWNYAIEITIDTQKKKGVMKLSTLRKMDELQDYWRNSELSKPISILNLVKYSKQAYYNGNPEYYDLPTQEQSFILGYAKTQLKNPK
jgi:hypothetical protein